MTRKEAMERNHQEDRLRAVGISRDDAEALRRISMTLHRWSEHECNGNIQRDELTNKPYWVSEFGAQWAKSMRARTPIADRETGALNRLRIIMARYPTLTSYVQGDPRGCALYILTADQLSTDHSIDSIYNRGIAVG